MCIKCYNRSAIVLAAIAAGVSVPPESAEAPTSSEFKKPWDGNVTDAAKELFVHLGRAGGSKNIPEAANVMADATTEITGRLSGQELLSLAGLLLAIGTHAHSLTKAAMVALNVRAQTGDAEAQEAMSEAEKANTGEIPPEIAGVIRALMNAAVQPGMGSGGLSVKDLSKMADQATGQKVGPNLS